MRMFRPRVTVTEEFYNEVEQYRVEHRIPSWAQALVKLAQERLGYDKAAVPQWGGDRKSKGKEKE